MKLKFDIECEEGWYEMVIKRDRLPATTILTRHLTSILDWIKLELKEVKEKQK